MPKQPRAEGQPKRPMSAYFLWMNSEGREMVKKQNPDAKVTEVAKKCGEEWKTIDNKIRTKYEKMAEDAKAKYTEDMKEWQANNQS